MTFVIGYLNFEGYLKVWWIRLDLRILVAPVSLTRSLFLTYSCYSCSDRASCGSRHTPSNWSCSLVALIIIWYGLRPPYYPRGACSCLCFRRDSKLFLGLALKGWWRAPDGSESDICSYTRANGGRLEFAPAAPDLSQYRIADYAFASSSVVSAA